MKVLILRSLNPCCNGHRSVTNKKTGVESAKRCLNPCCNGHRSVTLEATAYQDALMCLNPCCNGHRSVTFTNESGTVAKKKVSILVVMDIGL